MVRVRSDKNSFTFDSRINVLLVFANSHDTDPLRLQTEQRAINEAIRRSSYRERITLTACPAATIHDFRRAFLDKEFQIVHISGHGSDHGLVLANELGEGKSVPPEALADFFEEYSPPVKCVILNSCYSVSQGKLISFNVPYTIAMEGPIDDEAAIEFSRGFYDAIGAGKTIDFAYREGCRAVKLTMHNPQFVSELITQVNWAFEGDIHYSAQRYEEALSMFEKALQLNPNNAYAWCKKGDSLLALKRYEEALAACKQSICIKPHFAEAYNSKGELFFSLERYEEALAAYDKAIELNPSASSFYTNKDYLLALLKRSKKALAAFDQAIQLNPSNGYLYWNKGNRLITLKYYRKSLAAYDQAILFDPKVVNFHISMGVVLCILKRYEEALDAY